MSLINPPKPQPGDRVATVSPAAGLPGLFPLPHELGLQCLKTEFGLVPVEYPAPPDTMIVFDVDLGHTDPQVVIPVGGTIEGNGPARTITVTC